MKPGLPKEGKRANGGWKGHEGKTLRRTEQPDYAAVHLPGRCFRCGRQFGTEEPCEVIGSRQVFDLPEPKLEVTEHRIGRIECCGMLHEGEYPADVTASVQARQRRESACCEAVCRLQDADRADQYHQAV